MLKWFDDCVMDLFMQVGFIDFVYVLIVELVYGCKCVFEIVMMFVMEFELMLFDELMQGMGYEDVDCVIVLIKKVVSGCMILMVEYNMNVIVGIFDMIIVL